MGEAFQHRYWQSEDGLRLHARDYAGADGDARLPVVCIHGLTRNSRDFEAICPHIAAKGRRVLAIDVRGRGLSDRDPQSDYRLPAYIRDVVGLFDALGIAKAVLVGTSMGGLITAELAAHAPQLIASAIINDIGPEIDPAGLIRIAAYVAKPASYDDWAGAADYLRLQNEHALPHYGTGDWLAMAKRMCREDGGRIVSDYDANIAIPFSDEPLQIDPWERWNGLATDRPILLLRGAVSDLLSADAAARMIADRPNVRLQEIPGVGHAPMLDEPEAVAAIDAFLQAVA